MLSVIQRVASASVAVERHPIAQIDAGLLALVAIEKNDTEETVRKLLERMLNYRIFADAEGRMNRSLKDIAGGLLLVPQFTLAADTGSGNRPSFSAAADPAKGRALFGYLREQAPRLHAPVAFGRFGADMRVALVNDGPVTFILKTGKKGTSSGRAAGDGF